MLDGAACDRLLERWFWPGGRGAAWLTGHGPAEALRLARDAPDAPAAVEALRSWFARRLAEPHDALDDVRGLRSGLVGAFLDAVDWLQLATDLRELPPARRPAATAGGDPRHLPDAAQGLATTVVESLLVT
jgi:hypothetical protein